MNGIAIRAENLGKCYPLKRDRLRDLRETIPARLRLQHAAAAESCNEDQFWSLRAVSFELRYGEIVSLSGHNGAGKTTLLRILSGITDPTEGRAEIHGKVAPLLEVGAGIHSQLTGRENVYVHGAVLGMRKCEIDRQFEAIVDYAGLGKFIDTPVKRWSRGMCVRLAFSVAAHLTSDVLLVDDLFDAADANFRNRCLEKIVCSAALHRLIVFVSHDENFVKEASTRVLHFERGRLVSDKLKRQIVPERKSEERLLGSLSS